MVKKEKKAKGKCIFPLLHFRPHYSLLLVLVYSVGKTLGRVEDSRRSTGVCVIG